LDSKRLPEVFCVRLFLILFFEEMCELKSMQVADAHVDVLYRMITRGHNFHGSSSLQASATRLQIGNVQTQVFALFVETHLTSTDQFSNVLAMIDLFYTHVELAGKVRSVRNLSDLQTARTNREVAAILSLEGAGCLATDIRLLHILHRLGVRGIGLTWNPANALADGCGESRNAGLTTSGFDMLNEVKRLGMWVDIAHLSDNGVKDVMRCFDGPIMASHANIRSVYHHRRNLEDETIQEMILRKGWLGLTFEGSFLADAQEVDIDSICRHIDYVLKLGGSSILGFGSDFDGLSHVPRELNNSADYVTFANVLVHRYGETLAADLLFGNFERYLNTVLPVE